MICSIFFGVHVVSFCFFFVLLPNVKVNHDNVLSLLDILFVYALSNNCLELFAYNMLPSFLEKYSINCPPHSFELGCISYPSFYHNYCQLIDNQEKSKEEVHKLNYKQNWVTDTLPESNFHKREKIKSSSGERDEEACVKACTAVFFNENW